MLSDSLRSLVELGSWEPLTKLKLEELVLQLNSCRAITDEAKQSLPLRLQLEMERRCENGSNCGESQESRHGIPPFDGNLMF